MVSTLYRCADFLLAAVLLLLLLPLFLVIALAVRISSPGPILCRKKRYARTGDRVEGYAFRSMVDGAEQLDELAEQEDWDFLHDPRVTQVGHFLRRTSLDEIPLLISVIKGDLSLFFRSSPARRFAEHHLRQVHRPPGTTLRGIAEFIYSRRTFETIFEPTILDLQNEFIAALAAGRHRKALWVRFRGYWSFWAAVFAQLPFSVAKYVARWLKLG